MILDNEPDLSVVAEAANGAGRRAGTTYRDRPGDHGRRHAADDRSAGRAGAGPSQARPAHPDAVHARQRAVLLRVPQAGATGYVLKSVADQDLVEACRAAMRDEPFIYPGVARTLVRTCLDRLRRGDRLPRAELTPREQEVVKLIAEDTCRRKSYPIDHQSQDCRAPSIGNILQALGLKTVPSSPGTPFEPA